MVGAVGIGPDKGVEIGIGCRFGAGGHFRSAKRVKRALRGDFAGDADAVAKHLPVGLFLKTVQPHDRRCQWIRARQPDPAAACRLHRTHIKAIAVLVWRRRPAIQEIGPEMILDVGIGHIFGRPQEGADSAWRGGGRPAPRQEPLKPDSQHAMRLQQPVLRASVGRPVLDMHLKMVMQILADTGKLMPDPDAVAAKLVRRPDA